MIVLVTGASGFVGSHIAEQLAKDGHVVRCLVRNTSNKSFLQTLKNVDLVYGAVEESDKVEAAVKGVEAIIHAAGIVKARTAEDFRKVNVEGTKNLLEAAKKHAPNLKRFVYVSSLEAVGPSADGEPVPHDQENPITAYGRSKLEAEKLVRAAKDVLPVVILRPTGVYGPRDIEIFEVFKSVSRRVLPITGDGMARLTFTYVVDCAKACIRALDADIPSGKAYFITDGEVYVWREALVHVENAIGKRALLRSGLPFGVFHVVAIGVEAYGRMTNKAVMLTREKVNMLRQPYWVCSSEQAQADLGWKPEVSWKEGTERAVKWYRENGWL